MIKLFSGDKSELHDVGLLVTSILASLEKLCEVYHRFLPKEPLWLHTIIFSCKFHTAKLLKIPQRPILNQKIRIFSVVV